MPMLLYHYTGACQARNIAEQSTYYGGASFEDGLNAVPATLPWEQPPGYSIAGAHSTEALLELEWTGPVVPGEHGGTAPNTLYDLGSHRLFIPAGTTQHLRIVDVHLRPDLTKEAWIRVVPEPKARVLTPRSWRFAMQRYRSQVTNRWREADLRSALATIAQARGPGIPLMIQSEIKRPWCR